MNKNTRTLFALSLALLASKMAFAQSAQAGPYQVSQVLHVDAGVAKYWDYLRFDEDHNQLYASLGSHMAVIDAATGKVAADISGMKRNHGVALVPSAGRGFISDGDEGSIVVFDLQTHAVLGKVKVEEDADGIQYDPASNMVWVVSGDAKTITPIAVDVDLAKGSAGTPVALDGKPEYFVMDNEGKAFINLTDKNEVVVVDTKEGKVLSRWPAAPGGANTAMAIDREHHLLFLGCRNPQKLVVMDATNGSVVSSMPIGTGCDAVAYDDGYAFASCRDGTLAVAHGSASGGWEIVQTVATRPWAGTIAIDPKSHTAYLPTAEFEKPLTSFARLDKKIAVKPDTFMLVVVTRTGQ